MTLLNRNIFGCKYFFFLNTHFTFVLFHTVLIALLFFQNVKIIIKKNGKVCPNFYLCIPYINVFLLLAQMFPGASPEVNILDVPLFFLFLDDKFLFLSLISSSYFFFWEFLLAPIYFSDAQFTVGFDEWKHNQSSLANNIHICFVLAVCTLQKINILMQNCKILM